ncbi:MAG: S-adenosylmethionine decarboxylase [Patescibacteria group bacterium]|nr:S-adenosylmethionine decarboxylase [Patescibacteria group bacterium]
MKNSIQILADLSGCEASSAYFLNLASLKRRAGDIIRSAGFKIVRSCGHKFGDGGVSLLFIVSESHVAIHTWPEDKALNIDIFFCDYTKNNLKKSERAFRSFRDLYKPKKISRKNIKRSY